MFGGGGNLPGSQRAFVYLINTIFFDIALAPERRSDKANKRNEERNHFS